MTFKSFLLGSAAALLAVGGAEAADVSFPVAEPVNYVKVCDAFGTGYFYQPGTDTCIKIGGYVRFDVNIGDNVGSAYNYNTTVSGGSGAEYTGYSNVYSSVPVLVTSGGTVVGTVSGESTYSFVGSTTYYYDVYEIGNKDDHEFVTKAYLSVSARTQTELGLLTSFLAFNGDTSNAEGAGGTKSVTVDEAYLSLGPLLAGYTTSTFDPGGAYGIYGLKRSDVSADQVRLSWAFGGFGIMVAAEDYQDRVNSGSDVYGFRSYETGQLPDLIAAITASWGGVNAKVAFGWGQRNDIWEDTYGTWGVSAKAEVNLDALSAGSRLLLVGGYAQDGGEWIGLKDSEEGSYYNALASLRVFVSPTVAIDVSGSWADTPSFTQTEAAGDVYYMPVAGFTAAAGVHWTRKESDYKDSDDSIEGKIRLQRDF